MKRIEKDWKGSCTFVLVGCCLTWRLWRELPALRCTHPDLPFGKGALKRLWHDKDQVRVCDQQEGERNYHLFYEAKCIEMPLIYLLFLYTYSVTWFKSILNGRLVLLRLWHQVLLIRHSDHFETQAVWGILRSSPRRKWSKSWRWTWRHFESFWAVSTLFRLYLEPFRWSGLQGPLQLRLPHSILLQDLEGRRWRWDVWAAHPCDANHRHSRRWDGADPANGCIGPSPGQHQIRCAAQQQRRPRKPDVNKSKDALKALKAIKYLKEALKDALKEAFSWTYSAKGSMAMSECESSMAPRREVVLDELRRWSVSFSGWTASPWSCGLRPQTSHYAVTSFCFTFLNLFYILLQVA